MRYSIIITFFFLLAGQPVFAQNESPKILVSYNGLTQFGRNNKDSVVQALKRLGITPFDTLDRNLAGGDTINYTPNNILIWAAGDPAIAVVPGEPTGQAGLSAKEINEVEQFLGAAKPNCQKYLIIAGQNIAYEHGFLMPNGIAIDTEFLQSWLHVKYVANSPDTSTYNGEIVGQQPIFWRYPEKLISSSPDVVLPALKTPVVGSVVNQIGYSYSPHPATPNDSGACVTYYNNLVNTTFFAFDWSDPTQTAPRDTIEDGLTSGVTRVLSGALAFVLSHGQGCSEAVRIQIEEKQNLDVQDISPNPAYAMAEIFFTLSQSGYVTIRLFDLLGRTIRTEISQTHFDAGAWNRTIDLAGVPAGVYTCEMLAIGESGVYSAVTKKLAVW